MIELFGFFVAYQCLAFIPAKPAGTTRAAKLYDSPQAPASTEASKGSITAPGDQRANATHQTSAAQCDMEVRETPRAWYIERPADPNDRIEPADSESASSEAVE